VCESESVGVIRAFCAAARSLTRPQRRLAQIFFRAENSALVPDRACASGAKLVESNASVKNLRFERHRRNPHCIGTFALSQIFSKRLQRRESFAKGVSVSIAPRVRRGSANRNLYTKLSGKDVFFASVV
jgi:hypothetical protein